jgi:UDP-glucuronate 4-epimerase
MRILVTGVAGFIGAALARRLLDRGDEVIGIDNLNAYYDVRLKEARLAQLSPHPKFRFTRLDLADREGISKLFEAERPEKVVNLAAQAGVRYSLENPHAYVDANVVGFLNILEGCRHYPVKHLVYASSSSVYGSNKEMPFSTKQNVDHPVSMYAATKKANELMAHAYSHLYAIPTTGLRFFTVYGPWGRPDMALFSFTQKILAGKPIEVFNYGKHRRDFTYIDDIVEGVIRVIDRPPGGEGVPYKLYNIGNHKPEQLSDFIDVLEKALGKKAERVLVAMKPGDVPDTFADVSDLERDTGFRPNTPIQTGVTRFVEWYRDFYKA